MDWKSGDPLPNADRAEIDLRKFADYSMNPENPNNQGKWIAFAAIGYDLSNSETRYAAAHAIVAQIRQALPTAPAVLGRISPHGLRFAVQISIQGANDRTGNLYTIWQVDQDQEQPRLITNWLQTQAPGEEL